LYVQFLYASCQGLPLLGEYLYRGAQTGPLLYDLFSSVLECVLLLVELGGLLLEVDQFGLGLVDVFL